MFDVDVLVTRHKNLCDHEAIRILPHLEHVGSSLSCGSIDVMRQVRQ